MPRLNARNAAPLLLGLLILAGACAGKKSAPLGPPDAVYEVRGVIVALPQQTRSGDMRIHHEAIPSFTNREGKVIGMQSMTMPFPVAPGVSTDNLQLGDKIRFRLEVRWNEGPTVRIAKIELLPGSTRLTF